MNRARATRTILPALALMGALGVSTALGQFSLGDPADAPAEEKSNIIRPEKAETPGPTPRWLYYIIMSALGIGAVGVAIMPSQRTHQD